MAVELSDTIGQMLNAYAQIETAKIQSRFAGQQQGQSYNQPAQSSQPQATRNESPSAPAGGVPGWALAVGAVVGIIVLYRALK